MTKSEIPPELLEVTQRVEDARREVEAGWAKLREVALPFLEHGITTIRAKLDDFPINKRAEIEATLVEVAFARDTLRDNPSAPPSADMGEASRRLKSAARSLMMLIPRTHQSTH